MIERIPKEVVDILRLINNERYEAFMIGGAVRDLLMYRTPKDYDICTDMPLEELKQKLPHFHIMKPSPTRHTGIIVINNIPIEISTYRGKTLMEDMLKRDFTANAIAYSHTDGLIDYFSFRKDIFEKRIKLIDKTNGSMEENPLIILRALRLSSQLGYEIEPKTKERIKKSSHLLDTIKPERLTKELIPILQTENFVNTLTEYENIFNTIIPELSTLSQENKKNLQRLLSILPNNHVLRLSALFLYVDNNIDTFYTFARRINLDNKTIKNVIGILKYANQELKTSKTAIISLIREVNIQTVELIFLFKYALHSLQNIDKTDLLKTQALYQEEIDQIVNTKISRLVINRQKIEEMGYSSTDAITIYNTISGKIINNELPNSDTTIKQYIFKHFKRS